MASGKIGGKSPNQYAIPIIEPWNIYNINTQYPYSG